jgi:hypothetical protein
MRRLLAAVAAALALALVVASCGIGGDDRLRQIGPDDLQGLDETTTSTSTSTTTTPISVESTLVGTSTTISTESVSLYFLDGNRLQPVTIDLAGPASPYRVVTALLSGPPTGDLGIGLSTLLPATPSGGPALVNSVLPSSAGYATVDLNSTAFQKIDPTEQLGAIAQIVLTLTTRPGIGQVRFTLDGDPMRVPRRDGLQSDPGAPVAMQDYESLLIDATAATTTVAPTTTTEPAVTTPPAAPATSTGG